MTATKIASFLPLAGAVIALAFSHISSEPIARSTATHDPSSSNGAKVIEVVTDCDECPPMVRIPPLPGTDKPLYAGRHEVTWKEYHAAMEEADCPLPIIPGVDYDADYLRHRIANYSHDIPISYIPPDDFECYVDWIRGKTGKPYRLPTAAEWEHLARAGSTTRYPWGDEMGFGNAAIYSRFDRSKFPRADLGDPRFMQSTNRRLVPVESFAPNPWGLYDVVGNVSEYVSDTKADGARCVQKYGEDRCELIAHRGGGTMSVTLRMKPAEPTHEVGADDDHIGTIRWTYIRLSKDNPQPNGYRLVRN
jgi:formylglycine-generating enzyme required for sulfatase activity